MLPDAWAPPPWRLTGQGCVLVYRFPRSFVEREAGLLPSELAARFVGGLGAVMCLDYHSSAVGPYHELLFIPGRLRLGGKRRWTISRIYVSTMISLRNGVRNWAIPKQLARFTIGDGATCFGAGAGGRWPARQRRRPFGFDLQLRPLGPFLPADSRWLPFAAELAQTAGGRTLVTQPQGRGAVRLARVERLAVDRAFFPDVSRLRPLLALYVPQFELCFPPAQVLCHARELA